MHRIIIFLLSTFNLLVMVQEWEMLLDNTNDSKKEILKLDNVEKAFDTYKYGFVGYSKKKQNMS